MSDDRHRLHSPHPVRRSANGRPTENLVATRGLWVNRRLPVDDRLWREAVVRPGTNAFDRYVLAYRRRGSALKYDFAANYRYVGLDVLDLILRHGHVIRRENH